MMNEYYHRFNETLMDELNPFPDSAAETAEAEQTAEEFVGQGFLTVQVTLARQAIPVEGAQVLVTLAGNAREVYAELVTGQSGRTSQVALPTPGAAVSQTPGGGTPYRLYDVRVEHPGYYTARAVNIPIFDRIDSIQPISLRPLGEGMTGGEELYSNSLPSGRL